MSLTFEIYNKKKKKKIWYGQTTNKDICYVYTNQLIELRDFLNSSSIEDIIDCETCYFENLDIDTEEIEDICNEKELNLTNLEITKIKEELLCYNLPFLSLCLNEKEFK